MLDAMTPESLRETADLLDDLSDLEVCIRSLERSLTGQDAAHPIRNTKAHLDFTSELWDVAATPMFGAYKEVPDGIPVTLNVEHILPVLREELERRRAFLRERNVEV